MKHHEEVIIWWKLAVEMIVDEQKSRLQEVTPQSVAGEVYSRFYYLDTFPQFEELINACGNCLSKGKGDLPVELDPSAEIYAAYDAMAADALKAEKAKRDILSAHVAKLNADIRSMSGDDGYGSEFE